MKKSKKIYFASDQHFGAPNLRESQSREKVFLQWIESIEDDMDTLFLLGDLFDFWFEYDKVIPKGFVRILGKLASLKDKGVTVHFFIGNHDLWMKDYFEKELQIPVYHTPQEFTLNGKTFLIGHGDGLGPGDNGYKRLKKIFTNPIAKWLFKWLHPDIGMRLGEYFSLKNKLISGEDNFNFLGEEKEWLVQYCKEQLTKKHYDFFVFGHRHLPINFPLNSTSTYINTGDWLHHFTYAVFDGNTMEVKTYPNHLKDKK